MVSDFDVLDEGLSRSIRIYLQGTQKKTIGGAINGDDTTHATSVYVCCYSKPPPTTPYSIMPEVTVLKLHIYQQNVYHMPLYFSDC